MEVAVGLEPTKLVLQTSASSASASPPVKTLESQLAPAAFSLAAVSFTIGEPIRLPHSVQEPS
jgi:hypothetical protein